MPWPLVEACMRDERLDGHTVLLVEAEPFILEDVKAALEEAGASVIPAQSVREALDLLDVEAITASVLDFKLKGGTADDLCHQLTERKIPFVIYSGYTNVEGECSRWKIIQKPVDPHELVSSILGVLVASALPDHC
jgi:DNA-binding response OmpR family regulator